MILAGKYRRGGLVFPGSFNPLHAGHRSMASIAKHRYGLEVQPEISILNVDKPGISDRDLESRLVPMRSLGDPLVTKAARFIEKATCFPDCRFIIGADTALRLDDVRYTDKKETLRDETVRAIADLGCRFVVFGRMVEGRFLAAADLPLSPTLRDLCDFVPESEFREDISSTILRARPS